MQLDWTILRSGEQIMYRLRGLYERYGYRRFKMSKFEEYDLYVRNKDFLVSDRMITFTDARGILMALKPDVTLSIIKNTRAEEAGPRKVYYNESVYRSGQGEETFQEIMRPQAMFEISTDLLLDAIVKAENIELGEGELDEMYQKMADEYKMEVDQIKQYVDEKIIVLDMKRRKAAQLIRDTAVDKEPEAKEEPAEAKEEAAE